MHPDETPATAWITLIEALTWWAFRKAMTYDEWISSCHPRFEIWQGTDRRRLLHALEARATPPRCFRGRWQRHPVRRRG
jgi:hypothetical protein